eukprot:gnl/TRDRNA2_/TRDRNA2_138514_c0_seq1.p2 gnl/TRDRNA2_/TRDRNA2_138514_c0~~gnl/TRDRNA2_/TRDRNA2_138514_c0_seq1.p2  ORF type:complete len:136 (+),score=18.99 gnl/TRDRNA2_/TRDRNA2_138514_c0_seq1:927-1334(+)
MFARCCGVSSRTRLFAAFAKVLQSVVSDSPVVAKAHAIFETCYWLSFSALLAAALESIATDSCAAASAQEMLAISCALESPTCSYAAFAKACRRDAFHSPVFTNAHKVLQMPCSVKPLRCLVAACANASNNDAYD